MQRNGCVFKQSIKSVRLRIKTLFLKVLCNDIEFNKVVSILNKYRYAFIKTDVPYMPGDFPCKIPLGKDADIVCYKEDIESIALEIEDILKNYKRYEVLTIQKDNGIQIRIQYKDMLVYQIDLRFELKSINHGFVDEALKNRIYNRRYYILDPKYEFIIRMDAYHEKKQKEYHCQYLKNHMDDYNPGLVH